MPTYNFLPVGMKAKDAAEYVGVDIEVFFRLKIRPRVIGNTHIYHRYDLDDLEEEDLDKARREVEIDRIFGMSEPIPNANSRAIRGNYVRDQIRKKVRKAVFLRDGEKCMYCQTTTGPWHLDHVLPVSRGGDSTADNLVVACVPCNSSKSDKTPEEWLGVKDAPVHP